MSGRIPAGRALLGGVAAVALLAAVSLRRPAVVPEPSGPAAETSAREELARAEREHGAWSPELARALTRLAETIDPGDESRLAEARELAERSLRIRERVFGASSPEAGIGLLGLVGILQGLRRYAEAMPMAERSLAIHMTALGPRHEKVAESHYYLADLMMALGDLAGARRHFEASLGIWEETRGPRDKQVSQALHRIAYLRASLGDPAGAKEVIERSLSIREEIFDPSSSEVATSLNALANVLVQLGDRRAAMRLFKRAQTAWERSVGPEHPWVARSLTNQASLLAAEGRTDQAMDLLTRALELRRRAFGESHHLVAGSLVAIAKLLIDTGKPDQAEPLLERALDIQQRSLGLTDAAVGATVGAMARLSWAAGRPEEALARALRAERIARDRFLRTSSGLSEEEAIRYEAARHSGLSVALSAAVSGSDGLISPLDAAARAVWDEVIRARALVLDAHAARRAAGAAAPGGSPTTDDGAGEPSVHAVAASLPEDTALLSYVVYERYPPPAARGGPALSYAALLLGPGDHAAVVVPLGSAARIDMLIERWRAEASSDPRLIDRASAEDGYGEAAWRLRDAVWEPVAARLAGAREVLIVPDGALSMVSLAALSDPEGRFLLETGPLIHYVSAERDLLRDRRGAAGRQGLLALGGPDYDAAAPAAFHAAEAPQAREADARDSGPRPACPAFDSLHFDRLPGARREAEEIGSLWEDQAEVIVLTGAIADEATLKTEAPRRGSLHLATHAYSLHDRCRSTLDQTAGMQAEPPVRDSPLLLSGLALAGANRRGDPPPGGGEDGILTAAEIARMDLSSVEWVVLSGCETGLGRIVAGEGVLGLRRAFEAAGAGTLVMSLWPVEDGAARLWMLRLYEARAEGLSAAQSTARASLEMLGEQRSRGRTTHPFFWGGFVSSGGCVATRCPAAGPRPRG